MIIFILKDLPILMNLKISKNFFKKSHNSLKLEKIKMLSLKIKSAQTFSDFLKKFSLIDKQLLLEIKDGKLKAKTCTPEKTVVKYSSIDLDEIFDFNKVDLPTEPIKIGIFNLLKLISSFKQFNWDSVTKFEITPVQIENEQFAQSIKIVSDELDMEFACAGKNLFKFIISDDVIAKITDTTTQSFEFVLDRDKLSRIMSLSDFDSDFNLVSFIGSDKGIKAKGKSYNLELFKTPVEKSKISVMKEHLAKMDKEACTVHILADKIIFKSSESDSITLIGKTSDE